MQENNFERQVQQKAEELKLSPSEEVWQKIAASIAKTKNNRKLFALVFLLLLFIGTGTFIIWDTSNKKINARSSATDNIAKASNTVTATSDSSSRLITATPVVPGSSTEKSVTTPKNVKENSTLTRVEQHQRKKYSSHFATNTPGLPVLNDHSNENPKTLVYEDTGVHRRKEKQPFKTGKRQNVSITAATPEAAETVPDSSGADKSVAEKINTSIENVAINKPINNAEKKEKNTILLTDTGATTKDAPVNDPKKALPPKWKMGVNLSFGTAATKNGYLGITSSGRNASDVFSSYPGTVTNGNVNTGTNPAIPSAINRGTGIALGVFLERNISSKTNFQFGVNYKTYSASLMTGNKVDSLSNANFYLSVYRTGNVNKYINHFHFIELPVAVRYKLGRQNKVPLYLNVGVSISRLISTNALQFDTASGSYYKNNSAFNKTFVNVSGGILFSLSGSRENPFLVGPDINFSLNRIANSGLYANRRYSYFGIAVQKTFGKK